jgi:hypothetical protein
MMLEFEDIFLAEKRLEEVSSGRSKTIPLEEVMKRLAWRIEIDPPQSGIGRSIDSIYSLAAGYRGSKWINGGENYTPLVAMSRMEAWITTFLI